MTFTKVLTDHLEVNPVKISSGVISNGSFSMHAFAPSMQKVVPLVISDVAVVSIKIRFIQTAVSLKFIQMDESK